MLISFLYIHSTKYNKILFSGDTLFRFGCGRIFEGTYDEMKKSLNKIEKLDDSINVYCGHEYTIHNLNFSRNRRHGHDPLSKKQKAQLEAQWWCETPETARKEAASEATLENTRQED